MSCDIYRILSPTEYKELLRVIPKIDNRIKVETMMNTGMRYEELRAFGTNPKWYHPKERSIVLPASATKTRRGRTVHLTPQFSERLELYLSSNVLKFPGRATMGKNLDAWWQGMNMDIEPHNPPKPKTFRKTWETWLIFAGYDSLKVAVSQGHTQTVQIAHYQNLIGSLKNEIEQVKEITKGWMT